MVRPPEILDVPEFLKGVVENAEHQRNCLLGTAVQLFVVVYVEFPQILRPFTGISRARPPPLQRNTSWQVAPTMQRGKIFIAGAL